jgi:hypothetical protein
LDEGETLHKDYLKNCRPLIADGQLVLLNDLDVIPYMNILWAIMKKDGCYNTWLSSKRSNTYQVLQNSFISELFACSKLAVSAIDCLSMWLLLFACLLHEPIVAAYHLILIETRAILI